MNRIPLFSHQLYNLTKLLERLAPDTENFLLETYYVSALEELPATDYEEIMGKALEFSSSKRV